MNSDLRIRISISGLRRQLVDLLETNNIRLAVAESCTGGLLTGLLTELPGSSAYIDHGVVTYSNQSKVTLLNVSEQTLEKHGAVSEEVAKEMAIGVLKLSDSDLAISITGLAGPSGGSEEKPVGTVCFAVTNGEDTRTFTDIYKAGKRQEVRHEALTGAMEKTINFLQKEDVLEHVIEII